MIAIPSKLKYLIFGVTDELSAAVATAVSKAAPILKRNEAPFFADYTDHGIQHIESVLRTCELLIGNEAWKVFTRDDAVVLILAILTHDLGMLLNIDGFRNLVNSNGSVRRLLVEDEPWHKIWHEYQLDARRFDGPSLTNLLGSPEPVPIREMDPDSFSERGLKLAGEFIRRNHHRLGHEIITIGMPGANGRISLFQDVPDYLKDVAGLVARSHGVSIRQCLEVLIQDRGPTSHREYRHIHAAYAMALVRLADYLDLNVSRAPSSVLTGKSLKSPISRREWWSHTAIVDCHTAHDDPECLRVVVDVSKVRDVETYSIIEDKCNGIQQELDSSWAALGQVYGRFPPLNSLIINIRRVRSDLRLATNLAKLPFVPYRARLESARADLLKLLIAPLYSDRPGIGIRELVQNGIDAVRELEFMLKRGSTCTDADRPDLEGDIVVTLELDAKGQYWVVVADRGIGMTWQIVSKYYLTAGASFRQSDVWKKRFTDEEGEAQVLRSGRFGIGVLAAFLVGDRISVSTRHIDEAENRGVEFEFGLDDTTIEMRWCNRKVGTTVRVKKRQKR